MFFQTNKRRFSPSGNTASTASTIWSWSGNAWSVIGAPWTGELVRRKAGPDQKGSDLEISSYASTGARDQSLERGIAIAETVKQCPRIGVRFSQS